MRKFSVSTEEWETEDIMPRDCPAIVKDLFTDWINDGKSGPEEESIVCFLQTKIEEDINLGGWEEPKIGEDSSEEQPGGEDHMNSDLFHSLEVAGGEGDVNNTNDNNDGRLKILDSNFEFYNNKKEGDFIQRQGSSPSLVDTKEPRLWGEAEGRSSTTLEALLSPRMMQKIRERKEKRKTWRREKEDEEEKKREIKRKKREEKEREKQRKRNEKKLAKEKKREEKNQKKEERMRKKLEGSQKWKTSQKRKAREKKEEEGGKEKEKKQKNS